MIGNRLKELRIKNNVSQKFLSSLIGITDDASYRKYENNKIIPRVDKILILANYFNVSLDYLFSRTDNPNINY